ncbi:AIR synthase related protein, partial [Pseudomonas viridiflava]|uniref:AIR synthase related protein n=1 Tax=Pseudomonas viridiflava TaxID=33069 RepID=UPI001F153B8A
VLRYTPAMRSKMAIQTPAGSCSAVAPTRESVYALPGDDTAAIRCGDQYQLLAIEGMIPAFVEQAPWFAGWSAVMANVSDITAMGGRATAVVNAYWHH